MMMKILGKLISFLMILGEENDMMEMNNTDSYSYLNKILKSGNVESKFDEHSRQMNAFLYNFIYFRGYVELNFFSM